MEINSFNLTPIPNIKFGVGEFKKSVEVILGFGTNLLLILGGKSFKSSQYYSNFIDDCSTKGITVYEESVTSEPSPYLVDSSVTLYRDKDIDVVVSIGGGSVLDAGKAISAMLTVTGSITNYLEGVGDKVHPGSKIPLFAIPTTYGTGSETTKNAVISEIGQYKKSLRHDNFIPNIAIVDPELTLTCPKNVTAACGLDAFTQLLGAYLSTNSSPITDALALDGIKAIKNALIESYENPNNVEARTNLAYASMVSGIVLANAGLGLVHGYASAIGGMTSIPHGVICGTLLGEVVEKNMIELKIAGDKIYLDKYIKVGKILNQEDRLVETINSWIEVMAIEKLSYYGIKEEDLESIIDKTSLKNNPVELDRDKLLLILRNRL